MVITVADNQTKPPNGSFLMIKRWVVLTDRQMYPPNEIDKWVELSDKGGGSFLLTDKRVVLSDIYH